MSGCHAGGGRAGGNVFITANGGTVSNCVIRNGRGLSNWGSGGGGVGMYGGLVTHCVISNNASHTNKGGAGAYVDGGTLANSLVTGNAFNGGGASDNGGVVSVQKGRVLNCTIAGNKSDFSCACAPDGRVAAVLVNWTRKPQPYELKTPDLTISGTLSPPVDGNVSNSERLLRHIRMIRTIAFVKTVVV